MALAPFRVRMDENLKKQFYIICSEFGMNATTALNVFARAVVRERKIPFEIQATSTDTLKALGMQTFLALREQAKENGVQDLSIDEINDSHS